MRYFLSIAIALSMLSAAVRTTHVFASEHAVAPIPATNECDYYRTKRTAVLALEEAYDDARFGEPRASEAAIQAIWTASNDARWALNDAEAAAWGLLRRMGGVEFDAIQSLHSAIRAERVAFDTIFPLFKVGDATSLDMARGLAQARIKLTDVYDEALQWLCDRATNMYDTWEGYVYPNRDNLLVHHMVGTHKTVESCRAAASYWIAHEKWSAADYECGLNCSDNGNGPRICQVTKR